MMRNQWCRGGGSHGKTGHMEGGIMKMIFELNGAITSDLKDIYSPWRPAAAAASITFILRSSVAWWTKRGRTWGGLGALQHKNVHIDTCRLQKLPILI